MNPSLVTKKLNVCVYSGDGTTADSVRCAVNTLRRLLGDHYAVRTVSATTILNEPWPSSCALLVVPGGADLPYCRDLNGPGNRRISRFVKNGGAFLGICAGGYYASQRCEFEMADSKYNVSGSRELAFFPGTCRGAAYKGFAYDSSSGARAVKLNVAKSAFDGKGGLLPGAFSSYYNGGGVFVDASKFVDEGVQVLASYEEPAIEVDGGSSAAAVVYRSLGNGGAVLIGAHPEFSAADLRMRPGGPNHDEIVKAVANDEDLRLDFFKACLAKLGLFVNQSTQKIPTVTPLHLSSIAAHGTKEFLQSLEDITLVEDGVRVIKGENDTFQIIEPPAAKELASPSAPEDPNDVIKTIVAHDTIPPAAETPVFDFERFYSGLEGYRRQSKRNLKDFGSCIMYGQVVTSTSTMLEKNFELLSRLPHGFLITASVQVAGRGRGSNVWISSSGQAMYSILVRHPAAATTHAPAVFLQYIAAMAVVRGIKSYDKGYEDMPVKLKWPNDIFALDPTRDAADAAYVKISGVLANAQYSPAHQEYFTVIGCGTNVFNRAPTVCLSSIINHLAKIKGKGYENLAPLTVERLLARILTVFEELYLRFLETGFNADILGMYYRDWLHSEQTVTLEAEGGVKARIKGITPTEGLLVAEELGPGERPTGKTWTLQSDYNSFDFMKGLIMRKK